MVENGLLIDAEVADRFKVTTRTLRNWRSEGLGPPWLRIGRQIRYDPKDLEAFQAEQKTPLRAEQ